MSALDHRRYASLELLMAGARLQHRLKESPSFLDEYCAELRDRGNWTGEYPAWRARLWAEALDRPDLPLTRLCHAGAGQMGVEMLALAGLAAEDSRIAPLLGSQDFISASALVALWRESADGDQPERVREMTSWLVQAGLLAVVDPAVAHHARELTITDAAWALLMEERGASVVDAEPELDALVLDETTREKARQAALLLCKAPDTVIWLRGAQHNGRRTLARAIAKHIGLQAIITGPSAKEQADTALRAFLDKAAMLVDATANSPAPLIRSPSDAPQPGPETITVAPCPLQIVPTFVVTAVGATLEAGARPVLSIDVPMPRPDARSRLWQQLAPSLALQERQGLAAAWRIPSGTLIRAGRAAARANALDHMGVRRALRDLSDGRLNAVANRVVEASDENDDRPFLILPDHAQNELDLLELRCRHREALAVHVGADHSDLGGGSTGVRALLGGPSGAGKTLAARWLAGRLGKDLWRIDLAAATSKYIGETEKMLDRAFAAAEERDVILLLDEGDALMARRTDVSNANDRYANLETNFLLQRFESFSGILIVTTNAADRIDPAFQRRMDSVITFNLPDEIARYQILQHMLGQHRVDDDLLQEIAVRCALSGGQLRNVALHARLLAISGDGIVTDRELRSAIEREYRKVDGFCPLRPLLSAVN